MRASGKIHNISHSNLASLEQARDHTLEKKANNERSGERAFYWGLFLFEVLVRQPILKEMWLVGRYSTR